MIMIHTAPHVRLWKSESDVKLISSVLMLLPKPATFGLVSLQLFSQKICSCEQDTKTLGSASSGLQHIRPAFDWIFGEDWT